MALIERKDEKKLTKVELQKNLEARRERDNELVTGIFRYIEHPRSVLRFRFKKYAGDEYKAYELWDGERYRLPRMVARHLNQGVHYIDYKHMPGEQGMLGVRAASTQGTRGGMSRSQSASEFSDGLMRNNIAMQVVTKIPRCEFRSLEFMDDDLDLNQANISEVRSVSPGV
jgi:hypothetical protein